MSTRSDSTADDWAVVVGVSRYPGLGDLDGPENDARAFRDWLVSPAGGAVPEDHVTTILSSSFAAPPADPGAAVITGAKPTPQLVEDAFDRLLDVAERNGMWAGRRLYIYLAGHGFEPHTEEPALFVANATHLRSGNHIAGKRYADWFRRAALFDEILLFMDCCREPSSNAPLRPPPYSAMFGSEAPERMRWVSGIATKWSRKAREKRTGTQAGGVFTAALLAGLRGGAAKDSGDITDESLAAYLYARMKDQLTPEELSDPDIPKTPDVDYDRDPANRILIARVAPRDTLTPSPAARASVPLRVRAADRTVEIVVLDGSLSEVARGAGNLQVDLPVGIYQVQAGAGVHLVEQIVRLLPGSGPVDVAFDAIALSSPAPLARTHSAQDHQSAAARAHSARQHAALGKGSQIFINARSFTKRGDPEARLDASALSLTNAAGTVNVTLSEAGIGGHASDAWHACNLAVDPGVYQLRMKVAEGSFCRTIIASPDFQTQVFLVAPSDARPEQTLAGASLFVVRPGVGFDPHSPALRRLELARLSLTGRVRRLPDDEIDALASGALEDPMLALFAAHLLVRGGRRDDPRALRLVDALRRLLGEHPDVESLALLLGQPRAAGVFADPPLLVGSWAPVLESSWRQPALVPAGSVASRAAARYWSAGPWLVWRAPKARGPLATATVTPELAFEALRACSRGELLSAPDLESTELALIDEVAPESLPRPAPVRPDRAPYVQERTPPRDPIDLARRIGVPPSTAHETTMSLLAAVGVLERLVRDQAGRPGGVNAAHAAAPAVPTAKAAGADGSVAGPLDVGTDGTGEARSPPRAAATADMVRHGAALGAPFSGEGSALPGAGEAPRAPLGAPSSGGDEHRGVREALSTPGSREKRTGRIPSEPGADSRADDRQRRDDVPGPSPPSSRGGEARARADGFTLQVRGLGPGTLAVAALRGAESLSRLFSFDVDLVTEEVDRTSLASALLGQPARLLLDHATAPRAVDGILSRVSIGALLTGGRGALRVRLVPALWPLRRRKTSRVFQGLSLVQIIDAVLDEHHLERSWRLAADAPLRTYCVQYDETDLDFVTRLLAEEGIAFGFEPGPNGEIAGGSVIFFDKVTGTAPIDGGEELVCRPPSPALAAPDHHVRELSLSRSVRSTKFTLRDHDFRRPLVDLRAESTVTAAGALPSGSAGPLSVYDHRAEYDTTDVTPARASMFLEQARRRATLVAGRTACRRLVPGRRFRLAEHESAALNQVYLVTRVDHRATGLLRDIDAAGDSAPYECQFRCIPATAPVRPRRPRRVLRQVVEPAVVTGPHGEEIYTDEHGRVKVQFHWDRGEPRTPGAPAYTSCWVRVAQAWSGPGHGFQFIPRVGSEVLVAFLDGDVDRPVVIGSLPNAENPLPYRLPKAAAISGVRSRSTPGGTGYSEISFDDTRGRELLSVRAEKDFHQQTGEAHRVVIGGERSVHVTGNDALQVAGSRVVRVDGDARAEVTGHAVETVHGNLTREVMGSRSSHVVGDDRAVTRGHAIETVSGDKAISVDGSFLVAAGAAGAGEIALDAAGSLVASASDDVRILAQRTITLACGESSIVLGPEGITIESLDVRIKGQRSVHVEGDGPAVSLAREAEIAARRIELRAVAARVDLGRDAVIESDHIRLDGLTRGPVAPRTGEEPPGREAFEMRFLDEQGEPYADRTFRAVAAGNVTFGKTTADGTMKIEIDRSTARVHVRLWIDHYPEGRRKDLSFEVERALSSATTEPGAKKRLFNLGYASGLDLDDEAGFRLALQAFQKDSDLPETGVLDGPTARELTRRYGH